MNNQILTSTIISVIYFLFRFIEMRFIIKENKPLKTLFIDALKMILRLVNIGDAKSLACHPASTTHRQLNSDELAAAGVSEDMVRISVGIEHIEDIIADVKQALEAAK